MDLLSEIIESNSYLFNDGNQRIYEAAKQEAAKKRRKEAAIYLQAQKTQDYSHLEDLFPDPPRRVYQSSTSIEIDRILSKFEDVYNDGLIINDYQGNIAMDYKPENKHLVKGGVSL